MPRTRLFRMAALAALFLARPAAADDLTLQLKWVASAQFAGYFVAKERGLYASYDLEVTIKPGGPKIDPASALASGDADVAIDWLTAALISRRHGVPLVNIAQPFAKPALGLACRGDAGVAAPRDLRGKTVGVWPGGDGDAFFAWMSNLGIGVDGGPEGVTVVAEGVHPADLLKSRAQCVSVAFYDSYLQLLDAGFHPKDLVVFRFSKQGLGLLEDGLYVLQPRLKEDGFVERLARFVRASEEGWRWARDNRAAAVEIVRSNMPMGASTHAHQARVLDAVLPLLARGSWRLDTAEYRRAVRTLSGGTSPILTGNPGEAWTHAVTDLADRR